MTSVFSSFLGPHSHAEFQPDDCDRDRLDGDGGDIAEAVRSCGLLLPAGELLHKGTVGGLAIGEILHPRRVAKHLVDGGLATQHLFRSDLREIV